MKENFENCLAEVLKHEGGWANHPKDPGGATMKGITLATYRSWKKREVSKEELRAISDEEVTAIYKSKYWNRVKGDLLPKGLDLVVFDAAVNSGPIRSIKWLQQAVGLPSDGKITERLIQVANDTYQKTAIERACTARLAFLKGLPTWGVFGEGWASRIGQVRKKALEMTGADKPAVHKPEELPSPRPTLAMGDKGELVVALQKRLQGLNYFPGKIDGVFGARTRDAVMAFQAEHDMVPDALVGPRTWDKLEAARPRPARDVTEADLRQKGSRTIASADRAQVSTVALMTIGAGTTIVDRAEEAVDALDRAHSVVERVSGFGAAVWPLVVIILLGLVVWYFMGRVKAARVDDAQTGANLKL